MNGFKETKKKYGAVEWKTSPELGKVRILPVHLLPQDSVGVLKAQNSESQLVLSHPPGVPGFLGCQIIFPEREESEG